MRDKPLPIDATLAINDGNVIEAIKLVRSAEGLDLMQAKARVDRYLDGNPALKEKIDEVRREARNRLIRNVLLFDAVIVAALIWWFVLR
jgi:ribosomal protein L7/L12